MKVKVKDALESMDVVKTLTPDTVRWLKGLTETEFEVPSGQSVGYRYHDPCILGPQEPEFKRMAAAAVQLAKDLGIKLGH